MITIIDNFLPNSYIENIDTMTHSKDFFYHYTSEINYSTKQINLWDKQFVHTIITDNKRISEHCGFFMPIVYQLESALNKKITHIDRMKINMTTTVPNYNATFGPHIDSDDVRGNFYTAILYINESDGDTLIYDYKINNTNQIKDRESFITDLDHNNQLNLKQSVNCVKNRLLVFDGKYLHEGQHPINHRTRVVLNLVFRTF
jgi:hypothetical protein